MTNPIPIRRPVPIVVAQPTWCTCCEIHRATTQHPLCPSCADDKARELREGK